jgi:hypothetical protein
MAHPFFMLKLSGTDFYKHSHAIAYLATVLTLGMTLMSHAGLAQENPDYKISWGVYSFSNTGAASNQAADVNLRLSSDLVGHAWLAIYRSPWQAVTQERAGWDKTYELQGWRITPSIQAATGGFLGSSVNIETGQDFFIGAGLGRTNLKNYYNLNVDPNDAWSLTSGYRWSDNHYAAIQVIRDNRTNPDQQHIHLIYKYPLSDDQKLTYDILYKRGTIESQYIHAYGLSVAYDWHEYQIKCAYDPKTNFTPQNLIRVTFAKHF